jgi:signal transduction histidine kinase
MAGFLAGSALLVLPPVAAWPVFAAVAAAVGVVEARLDGGALDIAYLTLVTAVTGLIVYGLSRLRSLVGALHRTRSELAELAVTEERLRFARDLHDLLGYSLSAITLKTELTHRLVVKQPERAHAELGEILDISRQALTDVRAVASSYRDLSLDDEIASARSVLAAADVAVRIQVDVDAVDLPPPVATTLATVLREGITNLLRHSKAEYCEVTLGARAGVVTIDIVNDGARPAAAQDLSSAGGNGIRNLTSRVEALDGRLTAEVTADDEHRLHAEIPLAAGRIAPRQPTRRTAPAPTSVLPVVASVFGGYFASGMLWVLDAHLPPAQTVIAAACLTASLVLLALLSRPGANPRSGLGHLALSAQALCAYVPILVFHDPALGLPGFLAGSALLVLRPPAGPAAFVAVVASIGLAQALLGGGPIGVGYGIVATMNAGLVVYGLSRMRSIVIGLHAASSELAALAVTEERLRFATDLHDLLGFSLSAITLKSELSQRLVRSHPDRALHELSEVLDISRQALADVRSVASSYRQLSLDEEIASARSVLAAAGVAVTVRAEHGALPPAIGTTLATVLREGITNLLRHSSAERCDIVIADGEGAARIEVVNDGVPESPCGEPGSGLGNLSSRIEALGGRLTCARSADTFRLHAEIPL